ncbi:ADYC domain-containing protein [Archangium sp.]|uniref:ADYC domain-containing protein n=1 Tax=Archangium sp. TaxID=1872627 RepID=UPI00389AD91A
MDTGRSQVRPMGVVLCTALVLFATSTQAANGGYQSMQGTHVRGTVAELLEQVPLQLSSASFKGLAVSPAWIDQGQLLGQWQTNLLSGDKVIGVGFSGMLNGEKVALQIVDARPHVNVYTGTPSKTIWEYQVVWESSTEHGELCPGSAPALVLPGRWSAGVLYEDRDAFFFACLPHKAETESGLDHGGVAAKCVDWGYTPWLNPEPMPDGSPSPATTPDEAKRYHASCTTMASADYCGEGRPNTVNGTPLVMFNAKNVLTQPVGSTQYVASGPFGTGGDFFFETAWAASQVKDQQGYGWRARALCLTKKRWSTLPLNGTCLNSTNLPDPRTQRQAPFCESLSAATLLSQGAMLFSYSSYIDAGLYRFKHKVTGELLTTASLNISPTGTFVYVPKVPNGNDYLLDTTGVSSVYEGPILSPKVPAMFPGLADTRPLWRYTDGLGHYVTLVEGTSVPAGFVPDGVNALEGYVYVGKTLSSPPELHLWERAGSYATSTGPLGALSYHDLALMGFLPSLSDYDTMQ